MTTTLPHLQLAPRTTLLLAALGEPSNNDLRVVVVEAMPQGPPKASAVGFATPVGPTETSRGFELTWWRYVAYSARNESYFSREAGEDLGRDLLGVRENSAFLAYVRASTFATDEFPGPLLHWALYTEWHCIDVVSDTSPEVRELAPDEVRRLIGEMT